MANTLLFIDTNVLLDFYRAPFSDPSLKVFDLLSKHSKHLIISDQVKMEFQKNRYNTIEGYLNLLPSNINQIIKTPFFLSEMEEAKEIKQNAETLLPQLNTLKNKIRAILQNPEENDIAYKKIMPFFDINHLLNSSKQKSEVIDKVALNAMNRFYRGMPPRKEKDCTIGDAFNWEWCLHCCSRNKMKHDLIIVSRDNDFADPNNSKTINPFLKDEFKNRVGQKNSVTLESDLIKALKDINLEIPKAVEDELNKIQQSREEYELEDGKCCRCDAPAMFDAYCKKCDELVVGDADGENYCIHGERVFEMDPVEGKGELLHCPHCRGTRMRIEYGDLCGYCQHMADEAFDD